MVSVVIGSRCIIVHYPLPAGRGRHKLESVEILSIRKELALLIERAKDFGLIVIDIIRGEARAVRT
mgnify:FL=1